MGMNPLPPQAFTRDTLQKAYQWLLTQNASIKEMATSQDVLVSLYLKAQRDGAAALETPTIQNFKQELKSLAHLMGGLNGAGAAPAFELPAYLPPAGANYHNHATETSRLETPRVEASRPETSRAEASRTESVRHEAVKPESQRSEVVRADVGRQTSKLSDGTFQLDLQSLQAIADIRSQLNLGSDSEALRALIAIGYKHLKKI